MTLNAAESREQYHGCPVCFQPWTDTQSFPLGRQERITATAEAEAIAALTIVLDKWSCKQTSNTYIVSATQGIIPLASQLPSGSLGST